MGVHKNVAASGLGQLPLQHFVGLFAGQAENEGNADSMEQWTTGPQGGGVVGALALQQIHHQFQPVDCLPVWIVNVLPVRTANVHRPKTWRFRLTVHSLSV